MIIKKRAKNGSRTRDLNLGKVALYQLSYFRLLFYAAKVLIIFQIDSFSSLKSHILQC